MRNLAVSSEISKDRWKRFCGFHGSGISTAGRAEAGSQGEWIVRLWTTGHSITATDYAIKIVLLLAPRSEIVPLSTPENDSTRRARVSAVVHADGRSRRDLGL